MSEAKQPPAKGRFFRRLIGKKKVLIIYAPRSAAERSEAAPAKGDGLLDV